MMYDTPTPKIVSKSVSKKFMKNRKAMKPPGQHLPGDKNVIKVAFLSVTNLLPSHRTGSVGGRRFEIQRDGAGARTEKKGARDPGNCRAGVDGEMI